MPQIKFIYGTSIITIIFTDQKMVYAAIIGHKYGILG
jgi:hypothetical protein